MVGEVLKPITILLGILIILGITLAEGVFTNSKVKNKKTKNPKEPKLK